MEGVGQYENGEQGITLAELVVICKELGADVGYFVEEWVIRLQTKLCEKNGKTPKKGLGKTSFPNLNR